MFKWVESIYDLVPIETGIKHHLTLQDHPNLIFMDCTLGCFYHNMPDGLGACLPIHESQFQHQ